MTHKPFVRVAIFEEAKAVTDVLDRLDIGWGSINADRVFADATDPSHRFLAVRCADFPVDHLSCALRHELTDNPAALAITNRVAIIPDRQGVPFVVFLDIPALEAPP